MHLNLSGYRQPECTICKSKYREKIRTKNEFASAIQKRLDKHAQWLKESREWFEQRFHIECDKWKSSAPESREDAPRLFNPSESECGRSPYLKPGIWKHRRHMRNDELWNDLGKAMVRVGRCKIQRFFESSDRRSTCIHCRERNAKAVRKNKEKRHNCHKRRLKEHWMIE